MPQQTKPVRHRGHAVAFPALFEESKAFALLAFAKINSQYRTYLRRVMLSEQELQAVAIPKIFDTSLLLLLPKSYEDARLQTESLLRDKKSVRAKRILLHVLEEESPITTPKDVIIGFIGLAIIGPTLGLMKKRMHVEMPVIMEMGLEKDIPDEAIAKASLSVLEREIERASKNIKKVEPNTSDWFFGAKGFSLYKAPRTSLGEIAHKLENLDIPYAITESADEKRVLAISPSVNETVLEALSGVRKINT